MERFSIPSRDEVSTANQSIFDKLKTGLGFVPNLYAYYAKNETALADYLSLQNRKTTLSKREQEVINLVVSQYNDCHYCQSAHTVIAGLNGYNDEEILEIRTGQASFDSKLDALAKFTLSIVSNRGKIEASKKEAFFNAGYDESNLIDVVLNVGDKTISNYIHNITQFEIDFPLAEKLETISV